LIEIKNYFRIIIQPIKMLVNNEENLLKCVEKISQNEFIYFDTEGYHPIYTKKVSIIQFGIFQKEFEIFLIDCVELNSDLIVKNLKPILESKKIKKIIHDVKRDAEILFKQFGISCQGIFDTQIAYSEYLKKSNKDTFQLCSFVNVIKECCSIDYSEKNLLPHYEIIDAATLFFQRPMDEKLLDCAVNDVKYLHELFVFFQKNLKEEFLFIEELSNLWSKSFIFYDKIEKMNDKLTFFDHNDENNSTNYILRLFKIPDVNLMKKIIGKEGKNIIEMKKMFKSAYIYTAGKSDPPIDSLFFLGESNQVEEFTKLLPNKVSRRIVCGDILKTQLLKRIQLDTKTTIMLMTNEKVGNNYFNTIIVGNEIDVDEAILKMKNFIKQ
jgi:hypothetical protein